MPTLGLTCVQTHTHTSRGTFIALLGALPLHTSSCVLEICLMMTHAYTHPYSCPRLIASTNTYFSTITGAFPLHTCCVTRNWRTCFTSVRQVFLVETVVLQTVRHPGGERPFSSSYWFIYAVAMEW